MPNQKHMKLDDRFMIQAGLEKKKSFKEIGRELGKDCTTIAKEVKNHIIYERKGCLGKKYNDCIHRYSCSVVGVCSTCHNEKHSYCKFCGRCIQVCSQYQKEICSRLEKPPYVCNGCEKRGGCSLEKRVYRAADSQREYKQTLTESRTGINVTEDELHHLNEIISPLIENGHSIHHICSNHMDSIMLSEKTLYTYIDSGLLDARNIDMPRKVRLKPRKKGGKILKVDKKCRIGRTFEDFKCYTAEHPELPVVELDSVEGKRGGAVLLTIHFVQAKLQLAFKRQANDSQSVTNIFREIYQTLGAWDYKKIFPILLADNGSEFSDPKAIEFEHDGEIISRLFYCDPSMPGQKGHCENNHEFIRRIIPKGTDLGNYTQAQINLAMNHINSYGRPELINKSPCEMFAFLYGEELLHKLGVMKIPRDEIILKPKLLQVSGND